MPNQNESLDVSAKTVDEAIEEGLNRLGLKRDQVEIDVLNEGKRSLFGLKTEEAVVRITPKSQAGGGPSNPAPPPAPAEIADVEATAPEQASEPAARPDAGEETLPQPQEAAEEPETEARPEEKSHNDIVAEIGTEYLNDLLELMGIRANVSTRVAPDLVDSGEEPPLVLDITGQDLGILIGRRNETLRALQFMVRLMVNKRMGSWQRVVVDVENYRARRRQSLQQMAQRMAERAVANKERVVLEAMPAYERRLVHLALRDHPAVFTKSIGRDKNRKVTIIPK